MKKQIVLAFSGGLDTSFCVPWLTETFNAEVHAVYVECGYPDESRRAVLEDRATSLGASHFEFLCYGFAKSLRLSVGKPAATAIMNCGV